MACQAYVDLDPEFGDGETVAEERSGDRQIAPSTPLRSERGGLSAPRMCMEGHAPLQLGEQVERKVLGLVDGEKTVGRWT